MDHRPYSRMPILFVQRRQLLKSLASLGGVAVLRAVGQPAGPSALPPRAPGELDLHHIDTGRGNCTLIVTPGGTSVMIDAGAAVATEQTAGTPRPDRSRRPGEWQALYAMRHAGLDHLDYLLATHIHPDHVGDLDASNPAFDGYRLTGVSDVDHLLPVTTHIDRGYPDFGDTPPPEAAFAANYLRYLQARTAAGRRVLRAEPGSDTQIGLLDRSSGPGCRIRILAASGRVWTGSGGQSRSLLPPFSRATAPENRPSENSLSIALRLTYGSFSYYTGGDLDNDTHDGRQPWRDLETPVVGAAGRTEVAVADHHGYFDSCGPAFVDRLDAQVYIIPAWEVGHPGSAQVQRMLGAWNGPPVHDVYATSNQPANALINRRFVPMLKSRQGHVVVRVAPGGASFHIFILDSSRPDAPVTGSFGPYRCRTAAAQTTSEVQ